MSEITRRGFLASGTAAMAGGASSARPNVLLIMADQYRHDCLGANGNGFVRTPNLDRLAAMSVNFSNAFVQAPVCVPSRISYFTGRYPHSHKNRVNYTPCDPREVLMPKLLKDGGYQTGSVGKLHFYPPTSDHAKSVGFDHVLIDDGVPYTDPYSDYVKWRQKHDPNPSVPYRAVAKDVAPGKNPYRGLVPYEFTPTAWTGFQSREMLRQMAAGSKPFFLFSSFFKPHSPYMVPPPYDTMFNGVEIPLPAPTKLEEIEKLPLPVQKMIQFNPGLYKMDRRQLQWIYRSYYASVAMVDREIGGILDELDRSGKAENTIVIFSTDHGDQLLEHGCLEKNVFFEASVHLPFLMRVPGRIKAGKYAQMIETVDVLPTVLELCGLPVPVKCQGRSFAPLFTGAPYTSRDVVFSENITPPVITHGRDYSFKPGKGIGGVLHPDVKMVRTSRWKLNYYPGHGGELYDLQNDPGENRNLYIDAGHQSVVREMKGRLLDWLITADETDQIAPRWLL